MKLGTYLDLIGLNNFRALSLTTAQQEVSYYGLFGNACPWNSIYFSLGIDRNANKLGQHEVKILRMINCQRIFGISNGLAVARK